LDFSFEEEFINLTLSRGKN